jgi:signal transduction histidine kinase
MTLRRTLSAGTVSVTGLGLLVPAVDYLLSGVGGTLDLVLGALGAIIALALVAAGYYLNASDIRTSHVVRVAAWNALGIVVLGTVLVVAKLSPAVALPAVVAVDVLGVSAVAHVLIGVNDVRRIRARELADKREKLAVLNRLTRHNLRNDAQVITALAEQLADSVDDPDAAALADRIRTKGMELDGMSERLNEFQEAIERDFDGEEQALAPLVEDVVERMRDQYPHATIHTSVPESAVVVADGHLATALDHLVENAIEHGAGDVTVRAETDNGWTTLVVTDEGGGIPDHEIDAIAGSKAITQLEHASGLGLWVVKTVVETYGGDLSFGRATGTEGDGAAVRLRLPTASGGR